MSNTNREARTTERRSNRNEMQENNIGYNSEKIRDIENKLKAIKILFNGKSINSTIKLSKGIEFKCKCLNIDEVVNGRVVELEISIDKLTVFIKGEKVCVMNKVRMHIEYDVIDDGIKCNIRCKKSKAKYKGIEFVDKDVMYNIDTNLDIISIADFNKTFSNMVSSCSNQINVSDLDNM